MKIAAYIKNVLIALDQMLNTVCGGSPDETISAMAYRNYIHGRWWGVVLKNTIDFIFRPIEKEHCLQSYIAEERRAQLPEEYRKCRPD